MDDQTRSIIRNVKGPGRLLSLHGRGGGGGGGVVSQCVGMIF